MNRLQSRQQHMGEGTASLISQNSELRRRSFRTLPKVQGENLIRANASSSLQDTASGRAIFTPSTSGPRTRSHISLSPRPVREGRHRHRIVGPCAESRLENWGWTDGALLWLACVPPKNSVLKPDPQIQMSMCLQMEHLGNN